MSMLSIQCDKLRTQAAAMKALADELGEGYGLANGLLDAAANMREAADTIEGLRDRLQDADVAYNDAEVLGDVTQGLFRDLMAVDPDTAKIWALSWPELFGEKVARTLGKLNEMSCKYCLLHDYCGDSCLMYGKDDALLKWLRSEGEVIDEPDTIRNELTDNGLLRGDV